MSSDDQKKASEGKLSDARDLHKTSVSDEVVIRFYNVTKT